MELLFKIFSSSPFFFHISAILFFRLIVSCFPKWFVLLLQLPSRLPLWSIFLSHYFYLSSPNNTAIRSYLCVPLLSVTHLSHFPSPFIFLLALSSFLLPHSLSFFLSFLKLGFPSFPFFLFSTLLCPSSSLLLSRLLFILLHFSFPVSQSLTPTVLKCLPVSRRE